MQKSNKKGFTLIEIIGVIAILAIVATIFAVNMIKIKNQDKEREYQNFVEIVKSSADAYLSSNQEPLVKLYTLYDAVYIKVGDIKEAGYLIGDLKNPKTGKIVGNEEDVKIELGEHEELIITYPTVPTAVLKDIVFAYVINNETAAPHIHANINIKNWSYYTIVNVLTNEIIEQNEVTEYDKIYSGTIRENGTYRIDVFGSDGKLIKSSNTVEVKVAKLEIKATVLGNETIEPFIEIEANFEDVYSGTLYNATTNEVVDWCYGPSYPVWESGTYKVCFDEYGCSNEVEVTVAEPKLEIGVISVDGGMTNYIVVTNTNVSFGLDDAYLYNAETHEYIGYGVDSYIPVEEPGKYYVVKDYSSYCILWDIKSNVVEIPEYTCDTYFGSYDYGYEYLTTDYYTCTSQPTCPYSDNSCFCQGYYKAWDDQCNSGTTTPNPDLYLNLQVIDNDTIAPILVAETNVDDWNEWYLYDGNGTEKDFGQQQESPYSIETSIIRESGIYYMILSYWGEDENPIVISSKVEVIVKESGGSGLTCTPEQCDEGCPPSECAVKPTIEVIVFDGSPEFYGCAPFATAYIEFDTWDSYTITHADTGSLVESGSIQETPFQISTGTLPNNGYYYITLYSNGNVIASSDYFEIMYHEECNGSNSTNCPDGSVCYCEDELGCSAGMLGDCKTAECFDYWEGVVGGLGYTCYEGYGCVDENGYIYSGTEDYEQNCEPQFDEHGGYLGSC